MLIPIYRAYQFFSHIKIKSFFSFCFNHFPLTSTSDRRQCFHLFYERLFNICGSTQVWFSRTEGKNGSCGKRFWFKPNRMTRFGYNRVKNMSLICKTNFKEVRLLKRICCLKSGDIDFLKFFFFFAKKSTPVFT